MNNSFGKPCAELSLLKLCHGEKECHGMERLRGDKTHATRVTSLLQGKQQDTTASRGQHTLRV